MKKYHQIEIEEETIYLRKSFLGWTIIHPTKIDNKINWKNLIAGGNWIKAGITITIILIILGCLSEYSIAVKLLNECLNKNMVIQWQY